MIIQEHNKEIVKNVDDIRINNTKYLHDSIAYFYQKKEDFNLVLTNETKFMNPGCWKRAHKHIISSSTLQSNGCNKSNICQVKDDNESSKYIDEKTLQVFVKESRFSYIRPVDGATRLIVYNCL